MTTEAFDAFGYTPDNLADAFAEAIHNHADWRRDQFPERAERIDGAARGAVVVGGAGLTRLTRCFRIEEEGVLFFWIPGLGAVLDRAAEEMDDPREILTIVMRAAEGYQELTDAGCRVVVEEEAVDA
jgi:hypothetical protein